LTAAGFCCCCQRPLQLLPTLLALLLLLCRCAQLRLYLCHYCSKAAAEIDDCAPGCASCRSPAVSFLRLSGWLLLLPLALGGCCCWVRWLLHQRAMRLLLLLTQSAWGVCCCWVQLYHHQAPLLPLLLLVTLLLLRGCLRPPRPLRVLLLLLLLPHAWGLCWM
jgi:hypothetical protein